MVGLPLAAREAREGHEDETLREPREGEGERGVWSVGSVTVRVVLLLDAYSPPRS